MLKYFESTMWMQVRTQADVALLRDLTEGIPAADRAVIKSFTLTDQNGKLQKFVAYMLPVEESSADETAAAR